MLPTGPAKYLIWILWTTLIFASTGFWDSVSNLLLTLCFLCLWKFNVSWHNFINLSVSTSIHVVLIVGVFHSSKPPMGNHCWQPRMQSVLLRMRKQVFLLWKHCISRWTKDEVLSDIPEKIIQDRYCDLSPLQLKLYEQFSSSNAKKEISTLVNVHDTTSTVVETSSKAVSHVFQVFGHTYSTYFSFNTAFLFLMLFNFWIQVLQYLLKLCSHPLLVVGDKPPDSLRDAISEAIPGCTDLITELHALHHSPKLVALQEILEECGIGLDASSSDSPVSVGQHRVLIFAQHRVDLCMHVFFFPLSLLLHTKPACWVNNFCWNASLAVFSWYNWEGPVSSSHEEVSPV